MPQHRRPSGQRGDLRVLHVLPADVARGSQVHARALRDALDRPGRRHQLLTIFEAADRGLGADEALGVRSEPLRRTGLHPQAVLELRRAVRRLRPDVVVAHGGEALKYSVFARVGHPLLIYYAIGVVAPQVHREPVRSIYRRLYRQADLVAGVSEEVVDECASLLGVPPGRLVLAPNGRDPEHYRPGSGQHTSPLPTVAFVGHLTPEKHPEQVVDVVAALRRQGARLCAVMIGDGPMETQLRPLAAAAGIEMLGVRDDVAALLGGYDVLLFPSAPHGEGMPGVLIEAALAGVPAVATDVPGVSAIVEDGHTGMVVPVGDTAAMTAAVAALIADPDRRARMGAAARDRCRERFSLAASAATWERAIDDVVASRR